MESFNQMPPKAVVKNEVSDNSFNTVDHYDSESLQRSSADNSDTSNSGKRSLDGEQDSSSSADASGSPLPPRKRAKTQEEKEQRRMERIMRNRQAAHASREKKRKHLEALELRCSELEQEKIKLNQLLGQFDQMRSRVQQLETAIKSAQSSGDLSSLDSVMSMDTINLNASLSDMMTDPSLPVGIPTTTTTTITTPTTTNNTISAPTTLLSAGVFPESGNNNPLSTSGSPAPSLEEDCSSPETLLKIKTEEELFYPYSPETVHGADFVNEDPFGMMSFSFEPDFPTLDATGFSENSSKSRHPAAMTPLFDYYA